MIEVNKVYKVLITILFILQFYFFDIIPKINDLLVNANSEFSKKIEMFIFLLMYLVLVFSKQSTTRYKKHFFVPIVFLIVAVFFIGIASAIAYDQSMLKTIASYYTYYLIIAYFPFSYFMSNKHNVSWFYNILVKMAFFYLVLQTLQGLIYRLTHRVVLFYTPGALQNIATLQRFTEGAEIITFVAVLISIKPFLLRKKWGRLDYLTMVLIIVFHAFFSQGRMYLLISLVVIAMSVIAQLYTSNYRAIVYLFTPLIIVGVIFAFSQIFSSLDFTGTTSGRSASYTIRTYSYQYFYDHLFYHKWFGIGFADPAQYSWLLKGSVGFDAGGGLMTYQDVGIVGTAGILGISALVFFGTIMLLLVRFLFRGINKVTIIIVLLYIGISLLTLSPLDTGRIFPFILILAISDFSQIPSEIVR